MKILIPYILGLSLYIISSCSNEINHDRNAQKTQINKKNSTENQSEIKCPYCGFKTIESLPNDICLLKYSCKKCKKEMSAKKGDCCVFCSYGSHKCPSMQ